MVPNCGPVFPLGVGLLQMMELIPMNSLCITSWLTKLFIWFCNLGMKLWGQYHFDIGASFWLALCSLYLQCSCRGSGVDFGELLQGPQFVTLSG